ANPNSRFHMSNHKSAELLCAAYMQSKKKPHTVMLGHISSQRNTEQFAREEVTNVFREKQQHIDFQLFTAPLYESSNVVDI
ncbi:MAG: hypothetical protein L7F78_26150, partial [Syntrophales bacterium LBB04]|nr:hypothetical protein [Syntrophales bacterium LBB04]